MIRHFLFIFLLTVTLAVPSSSQEPAPDPHSLAYCVNHPLDKDHPMQEPHVCACAKPCDEGGSEDPMCKVYCRKDHCHCLAHCAS